MAADRDRVRRALTVLAAADHELAGWTCPASTECCRFGLTGREPYLTAAEWDALATEVARQGRKLPAAPRDKDDDGTCPFLSAAGRCTVYAARPLGCRTFYCDRASPAGRYPRARLAELVHELESLSRPAAPGRPLRAWLRSARGVDARRRR